MLSALRRLLTDLGGSEGRANVNEDEVRLAAAALLFHVMAVDGVVTDAERAALTRTLRRQYDLDAAGAGVLVEKAATAEAEAVDLYAFTSVLKRRLDVQDRERIIAMMWQLVFADGTVHEFEDNVVWRVAELLGVSSQERIRLKQAARRNAD